VGSVSAVLASPLALTATAGTTTTEKPRLTVTNIRAGVVSLHALTNPGLENATVYFYKVVNGEKHTVGYGVTGPAGRAHVRVHLQQGSTHRFVARAVGLNNPHRYKATGPKTHYTSKYSNTVSHRTPS
jgi:hypothetical protein